MYMDTFYFVTALVSDPRIIRFSVVSSSGLLFSSSTPYRTFHGAKSFRLYCKGVLYFSTLPVTLLSSFSAPRYVLSLGSIRRLSVVWERGARENTRGRSETRRPGERRLARVLMHREVLITGCPLFPGNSREFYGAPAVVAACRREHSFTFRSTL